MLTLYEFTVFGIYLAMLTMFLVVIQIANPGKQLREALHVHYTDEKFVENFQEETVSDSEEEKAPFNPEAEPFKMTENPMFSHSEPIESKED